MYMCCSKNMKQTPVLQFPRFQPVITFLFPRPIWKKTSALYFGWMEGEIGLPRFGVKIRILLKHHHILKNSERSFIAPLSAGSSDCLVRPFAREICRKIGRDKKYYFVVFHIHGHGIQWNNFFFY